MIWLRVWFLFLKTDRIWYRFWSLSQPNQHPIRISETRFKSEPNRNPIEPDIINLSYNIMWYTYNIYTKMFLVTRWQNMCTKKIREMLFPEQIFYFQSWESIKRRNYPWSYFFPLLLLYMHRVSFGFIYFVYSGY